MHLRAAATSRGVGHDGSLTVAAPSRPSYRSRVTFEEMYALAVSRKSEMPEGSATAELFVGGTHAIGKKLVEEAAETWMAARFETTDDLAAEISQVLYYVTCMMAEKGVTLDDVYRQL